jgi:hypothetical protein
MLVYQERHCTASSFSFENSLLSFRRDDEGFYDRAISKIKDRWKLWDILNGTSLTSYPLEGRGRDSFKVSRFSFNAGVRMGQVCH